VGDTADGVVALRVDPSAAAPASGCEAEEGEVGAGVDLPHAIAAASTPAAVQRRAFRIIDGTPGKKLKNQ
jgi:hypothetical protein